VRPGLGGSDGLRAGKLNTVPFTDHNVVKAIGQGLSKNLVMTEEAPWVPMVETPPASGERYPRHRYLITFFDSRANPHLMLRHLKAIIIGAEVTCSKRQF